MNAWRLRATPSYGGAQPIGVVPYGRRAVCAEYVELYGYFGLHHHLPEPHTVCGSRSGEVCRMVDGGERRSRRRSYPRRGKCPTGCGDACLVSTADRTETSGE